MAGVSNGGGQVPPNVPNQDAKVPKYARQKSTAPEQAGQKKSLPQSGSRANDIKDKAETVGHAAGVGTKKAAAKETPRVHSNNYTGQSVHDDIRNREIKDKAKAEQLESAGTVTKEAGKKVGGEAGAIAGGVGAAAEEAGKAMKENAKYKAAKEHANVEMASGDIKDYQKAADDKDKARKDHQEYMREAPKQAAENIAKGIVDGASGGATDGAGGETGGALNEGAKMAAGNAAAMGAAAKHNQENAELEELDKKDGSEEDADVGLSGDKSGEDDKKGGVMGALTGDDASSDGQKNQQSKQDENSDSTNRHKDQDKYITDSDRQAPEDMMKKDKKKKNGSLEMLKKAQQMLKMAMMAMKLFIVAKLAIIVAKLVALVANIIAMIMNAIAAIVQVAAMIAVAVGVAVVTVITGGIFLLIAAVVIIAGAVVADETTDDGRYDDLPCVEQEDWDAVDLEYLDTGDANDAKMICAQIIYGVFRQMGFDNNNVAGILTNFEAESGIDPTALENNANSDSWEGASWPFSDVYAHASEEDMPQYHAEYGVMLDSPDGTMMSNRYLYSQSLYKALQLNSDIGTMSSRFSVSYSKSPAGGGGTANYAQQFVNVYGTAFDRPDYIEQDYGFEDIRNTISGEVLTSVSSSGVGTAGSNTFSLSGNVEHYNSNGQLLSSGSESLTAGSYSYNIGPEVGTAAMESEWGADYPTHLSSASYKDDWMYCAGGVYIQKFEGSGYSVAERFDSSKVSYGGDGVVDGDTGPDDSYTEDDEPGDSTTTDNVLEGVEVTYTFSDGTTETFTADEWNSYLTENIIWGYCDEHQCSGIHQFRANAPSTYINPTWSYWCVESWHAQWTNGNDYWNHDPLSGWYNVNVVESVWHTCRHAVDSAGNAVNGGIDRDGSYERYDPEWGGYGDRVWSTSLVTKSEADAVDVEHLAEYNRLKVDNVSNSLGPHRVHIPHLSMFHLWSTDDQSVYEYWAGLGDSPAAAGVINIRGAGLGQLTNDRFMGSEGQDLHSELSETGYRGSALSGNTTKAMRNCHTEVINGVVTNQYMWVNPAVKNSGLYNYAKSRGSPWYKLEIQLQFMLDEEEGDVKAEWVNDWANGREDDPTEAAKVFLAVWEMSVANTTGDALTAVQSLPSDMIASHSDNAQYWSDKGDTWLASRDYSRSMSESIVQAAKATSDRGTERAEEVGYCASPSHGNTDIAHAAALLAWNNHDSALSTPGTQVFVCVRNNVFDTSDSAYHSNKGHYPTVRYVYMSCDVTVATSVRWGGGDDDYPGYSCKVQLQYLMSHQDKWMEVSYSDLQPGDVMIYSSGDKGHTRVYCGEEVINEVWPELANQGYIIVEGSLNEHSPWLSKSNPGYDSTFRVFRNVQPESESRWQEITICDNASMTTAGTAHSPTG